MKIVGSAVFLAALLTVAVQSNPMVDLRPTAPISAEAVQAPIVTAEVFLPGECCNDDFRQALPLWEAPVDPTFAKP